MPIAFATFQKTETLSDSPRSFNVSMKRLVALEFRLEAVQGPFAPRLRSA